MDDTNNTAVEKPKQLSPEAKQLATEINGWAHFQGIRPSELSKGTENLITGCFFEEVLGGAS